MASPPSNEEDMLPHLKGERERIESAGRAHQEADEKRREARSRHPRVIMGDFKIRLRALMSEAAESEKTSPC